MGAVDIGVSNALRAIRKERERERSEANQTLRMAAERFFLKRYSRLSDERAEAFESAAVLVAYACERIIFPPRLVGKAAMDDQVKRALRAVMNDATSVVANTTSIRWFRSIPVRGDPTKDKGIIPYLKSSVMMRTVEVEEGSADSAMISDYKQKRRNRCYACGNEDLTTAYLVEMGGWASCREVYDILSPNTWNIEAILSQPQTVQDAFQTFYEEYTGIPTDENDPPPVRKGAWTRQFLLGSKCHAMCQHHHIARAFLVESIYAVTKNIKDGQEDGSLSRLKVPEAVNSLGEGVEDSGGVMQFVPAMIETIANAAQAGPDSDRLSAAMMYTEPLFDDGLYEALKEEMRNPPMAAAAAAAASSEPDPSEERRQRQRTASKVGKRGMFEEEDYIE
jgi:ribosomal protein L12E/L44/L45/RPP1/RPP2